MGMTFALPYDNLLSLETTVIVTNGTALPSYPATNLFDGKWSAPFKVEETGLVTDIDLGSAMNIAWVILGNTNIDGTVQLQIDDSAGFGSTIYDENFAAAVMDDDGIFSSPHLKPDVSARYIRLTITGNTRPIIIGELVVATERIEITNSYLLEGFRPESEGDTVRHVTGFKVPLKYDTAPRIETFQGQIIVDATDYAKLNRVVRMSRHQARNFWMTQTSADQNARLVEMMNDRLPKPPIRPQSMWRVDFPVAEISRGLLWVDTDTDV